MNYFLRSSGLPPATSAVPQAETLTVENGSATSVPDGADSFHGGLSEGTIGEDIAPVQVAEEHAQNFPLESHSDVADDEGWIMIPCKELPADWNDISNAAELRSFDRSFFFPGEQIHILVCLSASAQQQEIINASPYDNPKTMHANGDAVQGEKHAIGILGNVSVNGVSNGTLPSQSIENNGKASSTVSSFSHDHTSSDIEHSDELEDLDSPSLKRFRSSYFYVQITDSEEPLALEKPEKLKPDGRTQALLPSINGQRHHGSLNSNSFNSLTDKGYFDDRTCGGIARDVARCYESRNGDLVVLLRINVGVGTLKGPLLEVLQFEKQRSASSFAKNSSGALSGNSEDPCRDLLSWLLPLDHHPHPPHPSSGSTTLSHKPSLSASGSPIFSFSNFRSYSMPSLPNPLSPTPAVESSRKNALDLKELDGSEPAKVTESPPMKQDKSLSFRGFLLQQERFSVRCGLEGLYVPGKRWRRRIEIIQPIEVHSFAAKCTTKNLLCVQIKNVAPSHCADVLVFLDAISVVREDASNDGGSLSQSIASIEVGNGHSLPSLTLRRGEEHSFILKPAPITHRDNRRRECNSNKVLPRKGASVPNNFSVPQIYIPLSEDHYAVLVSYRCNYTESKLFFKQATSWRPFAAGDLVVSVSSESCRQMLGPNIKAPLLPVQVITLEAANLTCEDLNLTVLSPEPSPASSVSAFISGIRLLRSTSTGILRNGNDAGARSRIAASCTHLWLQSAVPLGCVPARSSATVKLEVLPLIDGIITLDTLQIYIKEKGRTCIPEHCLEIYATSGSLTATP